MPYTLETLIPGTVVTRFVFQTEADAVDFAARLVPDEGTSFVVTPIPESTSFGIRLVGDEWDENEWF